jgi:predicted SnoaL-like aldol condensation-catalyzing enzyme
MKCNDNFNTIDLHAKDPTNGHWKRMAGLITVKGETIPGKLGRVLGGAVSKASCLVPPLLPDSHGEAGLQGAVQFQGVMPDEEDFDDPQFEFEEANQDGAVPMGTPLPSEQERVGTRRSTRRRMQTQKYLESLQTNDIVLLMAYALANDPYDEDTDDMPELNNPMVFLAATAQGDPDTMYYHQAMKQEDSLQFKQAMQLEIDAHTTNDHWDVIPQEEVPKDHKVLDSVWVMKRKRRIMSREVYKWKAILNVHGGEQEYGINFWDTFAWSSPGCQFS